MSNAYEENETLSMDEHIEEIDDGAYEGEEGAETQAHQDGGESEAERNAKKKKNNLITMVVIGAVILGAGGLMANKFGLLGGSDAPAVANANLQKPTFQAEAPAQEAAPAPVQEAAPAPVQEAAPAPVQEAAPAPADQGTPPLPADQASLPAAPAGALAAPAPSAEPEGFARGFAALAEKVDEVYAAVAEFKNLNVGERLTRLEERVAALEARKPMAASGAGSVSPAKKARKAKASAAKSAPGSSANVVEMRPDGVDMLGHGAPVASQVVEAGPAFMLQAVIPGRLWVKMEDGSSLDFEVGETLPDGSKVMAIDADNGNVRTTKGLLS